MRLGRVAGGAAHPLAAVPQIDLALTAQEMAERLVEEVPELREYGGQGPSEALRACCAANIEQALRRLQHGPREPEPFHIPEDARRFTALAVRRRVSKAALLRGYRVGHQFLWSVLIAELGDAVGADLADADAIATTLFGYVDDAVEAHGAIYDRERTDWTRTAPAMRLETLTGILSGDLVDPDEASRRLAYDLRGVHVALTISADPALPATSPEELRAEATVVSEILGAGGHLLLPASEAELWAWATVASDDRDCLERLERHVSAPRVRLAVGRPRRGIEGFRVSHDEALRAARFHRAGDRTTVSYRQVELIALVTTDDVRCRRFVQAVLGELCRDDEPTARLRETVLRFLDAGGSHLGAAEHLYVHKNTIYTRIRRAETMLGRRIEAGDPTLHAALIVFQRFPALLRPRQAS
ncbi:MAG: PucR family transcriptional regulator [Solirubrobacteraceae bacterium]